MIPTGLPLNNNPPANPPATAPAAVEPGTLFPGVQPAIRSPEEVTASDH